MPFPKHIKMAEHRGPLSASMAQLESAGLPLPLGTRIPHYGTISAVGWVGERYYWLEDQHGDISMMPASLIEGLHQPQESKP